MRVCLLHKERYIYINAIDRSHAVARETIVIHVSVWVGMEQCLQSDPNDTRRYWSCLSSDEGGGGEDDDPSLPDDEIEKRQGDATL